MAELLFLLGDQIYVDEAPETRAHIRSRRDTEPPPGDKVLDFRSTLQQNGPPVLR